MGRGAPGLPSRVTSTIVIQLPSFCARTPEVADCQPLAQIRADDGSSFICCGHNSSAVRQYPQDRFRVCWVNDSIDEMSDWDETDLLDTVSVMSQALSVDRHLEASP